ncbi:MAG: hypothetical protein JXM69_07215 [Anaerolineae bacterium]|nr:hypothetical protein [Anaerolineae bacterium]
MTRIPRPLLAAFILLVFVSLGCNLAQPIVDRAKGAVARLNSNEAATPNRRPTLRPTFTPTPDYTPTPTNTHTPTITPIPTETPTPVPTDTPIPTDTPVPTDTPEPTNTSPPPPPTATFTPAPSPTPDFPFKLREQGNRMLQKTTNHSIFGVIAITDGNSTPLGGYYVMGEHSSGKTYKSAESSWKYDALSGLEGYIKQGNVKFEPGPFEDGTWHVYVSDSNGTQLSEKIPLSYSSDPTQWVWDFIWWTQ